MARIDRSNAPTKGFDEVLKHKLLLPYRIYLQRRCFYSSAEFPREEEAFQIINLLKRAVNFADIVFTLGRYLYKENNFVADFNILLAADLSQLYLSLIEDLTPEMVG